MVMTKSYSIGTTTEVLDLKKEFQGGNYGARGKKRVKIDFNADDIYFENGKYAKTAEKVYTPASVNNGSGVNDVLSNLQFASPVLQDLHEGQLVTVRDGATKLGVARIVRISVDRRVVTIAKEENFTYPATPLLVLEPSAKFMNGDSLEMNFDINNIVSLVAGTAGTNNVSIALLDNEYNIN